MRHHFYLKDICCSGLKFILLSRRLLCGRQEETLSDEVSLSYYFSLLYKVLNTNVYTRQSQNVVSCSNNTNPMLNIYTAL